MPPRSPSARRVTLAALLALAVLAPPRLARACSVCGCGDPLLTSSDPAAITGALRLQVDTEYLRVDAGNEEDPAVTDRLTQWSWRLNAVWRPADRLSLTGTVPVVHKVIRAGGVTTSDEAGLGDVELGGRYALWRGVDFGTGRVQELAVTAGSSLPTGANGVRAGGARVDEHGQPGTGSFGPFGGLAYRFEQGRWVAFGSASGRAHTLNRHAYRYGAALLWSAHAQFFPWKRLALDLGLDGRHAAADRADGAAVVNTGGTVIAVAPGAYFRAAGDAWVFVRAQVPAVKRLRGDQDQLPSVIAGVQLQLR